MKLTGFRKVDNIEDGKELRTYLSQVLDDIASAINGKIDFVDNLDSSVVSVTATTADQEIRVTHNLGRIPRGYFVVARSTNVQVYDGTSASTTNVFFVRSSGASTLKLLVF